ncbi:MAG: hypothetical protein HUU38_20075 [Anaerolineales bacterium]|nr:hypothetical protein [Anaerolineales bacterium]
MTPNPDRLYELLPVIYRQRDAEQNYPLRDFLRVLSEQVNLVEADIAQLYENWFIETAQDWAVPYIGDLIGYRPVHEAGQPGDVTTAQGKQRNKILIPRREVANTIGYRRRKGTLALLELLANDVAGWPARAVEFYKLLGWTQALNHLRPMRGQTVDLRRGGALDRLNQPFDELGHTVDVRRIDSRHSQGRNNIPSVGVFVWRLKAYSVTQTSAYCREEAGPHCFTFSVLGNDTPLYTHAVRETNPTDIAGEMNLPVPIRRRAFDARKTDYYGAGKSMKIWLGTRDGKREPLPVSRIIPADLTGWVYTPPRGYVAVDPVLGRIAFPPRHLPKYGVWVSYYYGFSADIGGGEYDRALSHPPTHTRYAVGTGEKLKRLSDALAIWRKEQPEHAVIEITDSGVYVEPVVVDLAEHQTLQIRAANRKRPIIRLLDWQTDLPDSLSVILAPDSHFTLDGILLTGRGMQVRGATNEDDQPLTNGGAGVTIRHSTLVPGWSLHGDCAPHRPSEPSLEMINAPACVTIDHSIVGAVRIVMDTVREDPLPVHVFDSVIDATRADNDALCGPAGHLAHAVATIARSTVIGCVCLHALELAEDSIFMGTVGVGRRQIGCVRFSYVTPGSRTPRRYHCQPDLVEAAVVSETDKAHERLRVRPQFNSVRYGTPTYCQLALSCAEEIRRGAEDEAEMGVFHDLYQPHREANLRARLDEFTPAEMNAGIIFAS